jgi:hypothetical protein
MKNESAKCAPRANSGQIAFQTKSSQGFSNKNLNQALNLLTQKLSLKEKEKTLNLGKRPLDRPLSRNLNMIDFTKKSQVNSSLDHFSTLHQAQSLNHFPLPSIVTNESYSTKGGGGGAYKSHFQAFVSHEPQKGVSKHRLNLYGGILAQSNESIGLNPRPNSTN